MAGEAVEYTYADVIAVPTTGVQIRQSTQVRQEGATQGQVATWDDGADGWIALDPDASWASAVAGKQDLSQKGQPNGYASLDSSGHVPVGQIALAADNLSDVDTTTTAPTTGDSLIWDGTNFVPGLQSTFAVDGGTATATGPANLDGGTA